MESPARRVMNTLNKTLWGMVKIALYCLIVIGIVGLLTLFIVIPQWVKSTEILVPNLVNKSYLQALSELSKVGLKLDNLIRQESNSKPKGTVIKQDPLPNISIKPHHRVKITVSIGADLMPIPSVIGKSIDAANETLEAAGFRPYSVTSVHSNNYLPETVIAQSPAEGSPKKRASQVNLLVSLGRKPRLIQLPDLQNHLVSEVLPALKAIGLDVEIINIPHPNIQQGKIISHKKLVQSGDLITLEVSGKRDDNENSGRWLTHKHTVNEDGNRAIGVRIIIIDEYGERDAVNGSYAPGTIIDLEKRRVRVFGPTLVVVFENGKKVDERNYQ